MSKVEVFEDLNINDFLKAGRAKIGSNDGYTEIEEDGTLRFDGNAVVWDDIRIVPGVFDFPGIADPVLDNWQPGGAGATYKVWVFAQNDEVHTTVQLPHKYKQGSDIYAHVHWTPRTRGNEEIGKTVAWKIDVSWANNGEVFPSSTTYDLTDTCTGTDNFHEMTSDIVLSGVDKRISSILEIRLYRDATDDWAGVLAAQLPALLELDFHFEIDTAGSRESHSK